MSQASIQNKLRQFIRTNFMVGDRPFSDDDSLLRLGIVDSMGVMELLGYVQKEFEIKVQGKEIIPANFDTLNSLTRFIMTKNQIL